MELWIGGMDHDGLGESLAIPAGQHGSATVIDDQARGRTAG